MMLDGGNYFPDKISDGRLRGGSSSHYVSADESRDFYSETYSPTFGSAFSADLSMESIEECFMSYQVEDSKLDFEAFEFSMKEIVPSAVLEDIELLFKHYDVENTGYIDWTLIMEEIRNAYTGEHSVRETCMRFFAWKVLYVAEQLPEIEENFMGPTNLIQELMRVAQQRDIASEERIRELEDEIDEKNEELWNTIQDKDTQITELRNDVEQKEAKIKKMKEKHSLYEEHLQGLEDELQEKNAKLNKIQTSSSNQKQEISTKKKDMTEWKNAYHDIQKSQEKLLIKLQKLESSNADLIHAREDAEEEASTKKITLEILQNNYENLNRQFTAVKENLQKEKERSAAKDEDHRAKIIEMGRQFTRKDSVSSYSNLINLASTLLRNSSSESEEDDIAPETLQNSFQMIEQPSLSSMRSMSYGRPNSTSTAGALSIEPRRKSRSRMRYSEDSNNAFGNFENTSPRRLSSLDYSELPIRSAAPLPIIPTDAVESMDYQINTQSSPVPAHSPLSGFRARTSINKSDLSNRERTFSESGRQKIRTLSEIGRQRTHSESGSLMNLRPSRHNFDSTYHKYGDDKAHQQKMRRAMSVQIDGSQLTFKNTNDWERIKKAIRKQSVANLMQVGKAHTDSAILMYKENFDTKNLDEKVKNVVELETEIKNKKTEIKDLKDTNKNINEMLKDKEEEIQNLKTDQEQLRNSITRMNTQYSSNKERNDLDLQQLSVLQDEVAVKREKIIQLQAEMKKLKNDLHVKHVEDIFINVKQWTKDIQDLQDENLKLKRENKEKDMFQQIEERSKILLQSQLSEQKETVETLVKQIEKYRQQRRISPSRLSDRGGQILSETPYRRIKQADSHDYRAGAPKDRYLRTMDKKNRSRNKADPLRTAEFKNRILPPEGRFLREYSWIELERKFREANPRLNFKGETESFHSQDYDFDNETVTHVPIR